MSNIRTRSMPYIGVRGSPERGYFVPACIGSGSWADFERCSRIHACGFRCLEGKNIKTLNKKNTFGTKTFKNAVFEYLFNKSYSHGSKLAVFTTFFQGFRPTSLLLFNIKTLNESLLLARKPLKT